VEHGYMKSDQQLRREKMVKLVSDNYASAHDTVWGAWSDSDMRNWLIEHGYLRSDAQVRRDELIKSMNDKYTDVSARTAAYLTWPDARLRAYLRERGVSEKALPTGRPGLLQETRIRWVQTHNRAEALYAKVRDLINSSVNSAEETLSHVLELLSGTADQSKDYANEKYAEGKGYANEKTAQGKGYANEKYEQGHEYASQAKGYGDEKVGGAREKVGEKVKQGGAKIKGEL